MDEVTASTHVHADLLPGPVATTLGYAGEEPEERLHRGRRTAALHVATGGVDAAHDRVSAAPGVRTP